MLYAIPLDSLDTAEANLNSPLVAVAAPTAPTTVTETPVATAAPAPAAMVSALAPVVTVATTGKPPAALGTLTSSIPATWPMLGALLLVVALILLLGKLVKRVQNTRAGQGAALSIKGGVQIGAKERVVWMQAGDTHLLLGVSPGRVQTLHVFDVAPDFSTQAANETLTPAAAETTAATPASHDFSERLKTLLAHARAKGLDTEVTAAPVQAAAAATPMVAATSKPLFSFRA